MSARWRWRVSKGRVWSGRGSAPSQIYCEVVTSLPLVLSLACAHTITRLAPESAVNFLLRPIVTYAHSLFAKACALSVPADASARPSSNLVTITPSPGSRPIIAYAHSEHSVFAKACALSVPANASARPSSTLVTVAYDHSVFATPCALDVPANASRPIVAYAHMFYMSCALNVPTCKVYGTGYKLPNGEVVESTGTLHSGLLSKTVATRLPVFATSSASALGSSFGTKYGQWRVLAIESALVAATRLHAHTQCEADQA